MKPTEEQIRYQFEKAVAGASGDSAHDGAVRWALGWVLGESDDAPYFTREEEDEN